MLEISNPKQTGIAAFRDFQLSGELLNAVCAGLRKQGLDQHPDGDETDFTLVTEALKQGPKKLKGGGFRDNRLAGQNPRDAVGNLLRLIIPGFRRNTAVRLRSNPHHRFLDNQVIFDLQHGDRGNGIERRVRPGGTDVKNIIIRERSNIGCLCDLLVCDHEYLQPKRTEVIRLRFREDESAIRKQLPAGREEV